MKPLSRSELSSGRITRPAAGSLMFPFIISSGKKLPDGVTVICPSPFRNVIETKTQSTFPPFFSFHSLGATCTLEVSSEMRSTSGARGLQMALALLVLCTARSAPADDELLAQVLGIDVLATRCVRDVDGERSSIPDREACPLAGNDGEGGIEEVLDIDLDEIDDDVHGQVSPHPSFSSGHECWSHAPCLAWQKEMPSLEEIIEEERSYFLRTDGDGDSKLNRAEFVRHFLDSMGANLRCPKKYLECGCAPRGDSCAIHTGDFSKANSSSGDVQEEDAAFSFTEFDQNSDSFVDWEEWSKIMSLPHRSATAPPPRAPCTFSFACSISVL